MVNALEIFGRAELAGGAAEFSTVHAPVSARYVESNPRLASGNHAA